VLFLLLRSIFHQSKDIHAISADVAFEHWLTVAVQKLEPPAYQTTVGWNLPLFLGINPGRRFAEFSRRGRSLKELKQKRLSLKDH